MGFEFVLLNPKMIKVLYYRLLRANFTTEQASNLVANVMGLGPSEHGWTVKELTKLLYEEYRDKHPALESTAI